MRQRSLGVRDGNPNNEAGLSSRLVECGALQAQHPLTQRVQLEFLKLGELLLIDELCSHSKPCAPFTALFGATFPAPFAATFPFLPAKNHTFTLMANAVRVADLLL